MTFQRSLAWVVGQFLVVLSLELAGLAILARALRPVEIGWYAAAFAILEFARFLGAMELHTVIVRSDRPDLVFRRHVMALAFGASSVITLLLGGALVLMPPELIGAMPRQLLFVMLPVLVINCFAMTGHALLIRDRRFEAIFFLKLASTLVFLGVAIPLALTGAGAHAMAFGLLASTLTHAVLSLLVTQGAFWVRPVMRDDGRTTRFAGTILAISFAHHATLSAVPFLIGRLLGFATLGHYVRAEDFIRQGRRMLEETVMPALVPFVFDAARDADERQSALRPRFLAAIANLTAVTWPGTLLIIVLSGPIVRVILGDQWLEVPPILRILAAGFLAYPLAAVAYIYVLALRREAALLRVDVAVTAATIGSVVLFWSEGLAVVCAAIVLLQLLHTLLRVGLALPWLGIGGAVLAAALLPSGVVAGTTAGAVAICVAGLVALGLSDALVLLGAFCAAIPVWFFALFASRHPLGREIKTVLAARVR